MFSQSSNVPPIALFGQSQSSTPFSIPSGTRSIFGTLNSSNNFSNSIIPPSTTNGTSLFGSSTSNSIFSNTPRVGLFTTNSITPLSTSSIFSHNASNSNIFSSAPKQGPLGFGSQSSSGNLFQQSSVYQNSTGPGTPIPFRAVQSSDSVMKGGTQLNVQVRLECIPAMKEYENKSLEELRFEDYLAGRKGITNTGFQPQANIQQGLFSSLPNPTGKTMFNSTNNSIYQNVHQSPQTSGIFSSKPQTQLSIGQFSHPNKAVSNQSNSIFGSMGLSSNSALFSQQGNPQFSSLNQAANSTNSHNPSLSNLPSSVFSAQPTSNIFTSKPTIGAFNPQSGYTLGQNFNPHFGKTNTLPGQLLNTSNGSLLSNPHVPQVSGLTGKTFDLTLPKASSAFITNAPLVSSNPHTYSSQMDSRYSDHVDSPNSLERQLLLLSRIPFVDSPLFRDAKQTVEKPDFDMKHFPADSYGDFAKRSAPPDTIFKMKIQQSNRSHDQQYVENSAYFSLSDSPNEQILPESKPVLVSRKTSVKKLELSCSRLSDNLASNVSSVLPPTEQPGSLNMEPSISGSQIGDSLEHYPQTASPSNKNSTPPDIQGSVGDLVSALIDDDHISHDLLRLTRPDYSTSPPCIDIIQQLSANLQLIIEDFTIQRRGLGQIRFPGSTDITGMDLDKIVFIEEKEVTLYPPGTLKPKNGFGLNKEAIISLMGVWPTDKSTRKPICDPDKILASRYYEKVEKCTEKLGAQFIDYDIKSGVWTFRVYHFSKYKLVISDSSDGEDCDFDEFKQKAEGACFQNVSHSISKEVSSRGCLDGYIDCTQQFIDVTVPFVSAHNQIPMMRNLFFSPNSYSFSQNDVPIRSSVSSFLSQKLSEETIFSFQNSFLNFQKSNLPQTSGYSCISPVSAVDSIIQHRCNYMADSSIVWNRGFRASWGRNTTVILSSTSRSYSSSNFAIMIFQCCSQRNIDSTIYLPFLDTLRTIFINPGTDAIRSAMEDNFELFLYFLRSSFYHTFIESLSSNQHDVREYSAHICPLVSTILLPAERLSSSSYVNSIESVDSVNTWLSRIITESIESLNFDDIGETYLSDILSELTKGNIEEAAFIAMNHSDYHLAMSISQGVNDQACKFKLYLKRQLSVWMSHPRSDFVNPYRIYIYGILSGCFEDLFVEPFLSIFLKMNWLQSLSVIINFSKSPNYPISESFLSYKHYAFNNCLPFPHPFHIDYLIHSRMKTVDVYYSLMSKAYINDMSLSTLLSVAGYSHFLLDYSLSFKILLAISGSEARSSSENLLRSQIVLNFAHQLSLSKYWHMAVFILLFLPPSTHKNYVINALVERECSENSYFSTQESFLTEYLSFDSKLLCSFKSSLANYLHLYNEYFLLLIQSSEASLAHKLILNKFVFPYVINEELSLLKDKLRLVEYQGRINQIINWEMEGSIFLDYIRIFETINKLVDGNCCSAFELEELLVGVRSICTRISSMKFDLLQTEGYLTISEISKNLVLFLKIITSIQEYNLHQDSFSQQTIKYFVRLPLISDNFTVIANEMCDRYLIDIDLN